MVKTSYDNFPTFLGILNITEDNSKIILTRKTVLTRDFETCLPEFEQEDHLIKF